MPSSGTRVLITGGAGFIGSHLTDRLLDQGCEVRVLDNFATGHRGNLEHVIDDIEVVEGDIQSYERVHNAVRDCNIVFHLGALPSVPRSIQDPLTSTNINAMGTLNVLLAARDAGVRRVVYASSSSVYGANPELPKRIDMPTLPISPYAVAKLAGEGFCRAFHEVFNIETVAMRYFNVFGPRQDPLSHYAAVIPRFITAVLENRHPIVHGDGEQSRDFTFVDNAVEATVLASEAEGVSGQAFNAACGERTSLNELLQSIASVSGKHVEAEYTDPRPGDVPHSLADITQTREKLGFEPLVSVEVGVERTFEYYARLHAEA